MQLKITLPLTPQFSFLYGYMPNMGNNDLPRNFTHKTFLATVTSVFVWIWKEKKEQTFGIQVRVSIMLAVRSASNHFMQLFCFVYNYWIYLEGMHLGRRRGLSLYLVFELSLKISVKI